jgi:hypothetical protein
VNLISSALVQISSRLVRQKQLWRIDKRPRQSHPLPLSPRKFSGTMAGSASQSDTSEQIVGPTSGVAFCRAADQ